MFKLSFSFGVQQKSISIEKQREREKEREKERKRGSATHEAYERDFVFLLILDILCFWVHLYFEFLSLTQRLLFICCCPIKKCVKCATKLAQLFS